MSENSELVRLADASLWIVRKGQGPPLALCHGGPGMWDYLGQVAHLVDDLATVLRYDQRACGRSTGDSRYSLATAVADLDALRAHVGAEQWIVGGHSFGASLALAYCLEHPERARGLIYVSGTSIDPGWHATYHANRAARLGPDGLQQFAHLREQIAHSEDSEKAAAERAYAVLYASTDLADPSGAARVVDALGGDGLQVNQDVNRALGADATRVIESDAIRTRIARLHIPTLIVHGAADPRPVDSARQLAELLPNAHLAVLPSCGHYPWLEQTDAFRKILREFVEKPRRIEGRDAHPL